MQEYSTVFNNFEGPTQYWRGDPKLKLKYLTHFKRKCCLESPPLIKWNKTKKNNKFKVLKINPSEIEDT